MINRVNRGTFVLLHWSYPSRALNHGLRDNYRITWNSKVIPAARSRGNMDGSCRAKVGALGRAWALGMTSWRRDPRESNPLAVPQPSWHNPILVASVSSSLESSLRLHSISMPPQTAFWTQSAGQVTGGTAPPMTTSMESGDRVVFLLRG